MEVVDIEVSGSRRMEAVAIEVSISSSEDQGDVIVVKNLVTRV